MPPGQIYLDKNLRVEDGILFVDVTHEPANWYELSANYTTGVIHSIQQFNTYTKYEIRCKVAIGHGLWPAFWTFGGGLWPIGNTEIDIFEFFGVSDRFETSVHFWENDQEHFHKEINLGYNASEDFHVYGVEYDKFFVNFFLDGTLVSSLPRYFTPSGSAVTWCNVAPGVYYEHPEYPIHGNPLNVIGGMALYYEPSMNNEVQEVSMEIDYIRVYQREPQEGLVDLCDQYKLDGPSVLCTEDQESVICFNGPLDVTSFAFSVSNNLNIVSNPNDGHECIRVSMQNNNQMGWVQLNTEASQACPEKTYEFPVQLGFGFLPFTAQILNVNRCEGEATIGFLDDISASNSRIRWSIKRWTGEFASNPTINVNRSGNLATINFSPHTDGLLTIEVEIIIENECGSITLTRMIILEEEDCTDLPKFQIYPNPSSNYVDLLLEESHRIDEIDQLILTKINTSEHIMTRKIYTEVDLHLNTEELISGVYSLTLLFKNGQVNSETLIIE